MRLIDLPPGVNGMTVLDENGDFNIYINARNSNDQSALAFIHESAHISNGHFGEAVHASLLEWSLSNDADGSDSQTQ